MHLSPFFPEAGIVSDGIGVVGVDFSIHGILPGVPFKSLSVVGGSGVTSLRVMVGRFENIGGGGVSSTVGGRVPVLFDLLTCLERDLVVDGHLHAPFPSGRLCVDVNGGTDVLADILLLDVVLGPVLVESFLSTKSLSLELSGSVNSVTEEHLVPSGDSEHDGREANDLDLLAHGLILDVRFKTRGAELQLLKHHHVCM